MKLERYLEFHIKVTLKENISTSKLIPDSPNYTRLELKERYK